MRSQEPAHGRDILILAEVCDDVHRARSWFSIVVRRRELCAFDRANEEIAQANFLRILGHHGSGCDLGLLSDIYEYFRGALNREIDR